MTWDGEDRRKPPTIHNLETRVALAEAALAALTREVHAINSNITRVVWVVVAAILAALVQFALKGGFK